jgi:hypothetical protein
LVDGMMEFVAGSAAGRLAAIVADLMRLFVGW